MIINIIVIVCGLICSFLLFYRFPMLKEFNNKTPNLKISIIVPARNEEKNIGNLLKDLSNQSIDIHQIICVNDDSNDDTLKIIKKFNVDVVDINKKPDDWTGKSWACFTGYKKSTGDLLLFIDADVRLSKDAIKKVSDEYIENKKVISIQPKHKTKKIYEQFSLIFNIIQLAANGTCFIKKNIHMGLFGPLILIDKKSYEKIGTHEAVKLSIVEDVSLGEKLKDNNMDYEILLGGSDVSFRMYSGGFKSLFQGWSKNFASGAAKTNIIIIALVFLWITSSTSVIFNFLIYNLKGEFILSLAYIVFFIIWIVEIFRISSKIGDFKVISIILYPINLMCFFVIFLVSIIKKILKANTVWKDRKIKV